MTIPQAAVLPRGSLILVTGVTGYVASTIADQLLLHGFRMSICPKTERPMWHRPSSYTRDLGVRGTARDPKSDKASWMPEYFNEKYGNDIFEMVQVADMEVEGCLDDAVAGCDGMIHVASYVKFEADPDKVIKPSIAFIDNALRAAEKEPSIKRFVFTSSSAAVSQNRVGERYDLTDKMWADWAVEAALASPPYTMERALANYCASKVLTEQRLWKYVEERKPHFVVNSVLPDIILGLAVNIEKQGYESSLGVFKQMFDSSGDNWRAFHPQWCVDSIDMASLHIAGLLHPHTASQRIFAYAHAMTWTEFIERLKRMYPDHEFPGKWPVSLTSIDMKTRMLIDVVELSPDEGKDLANVCGREQAEDLLKWIGKPGWRPLDDFLTEVCDTLV